MSALRAYKTTSTGGLGSGTAGDSYISPLVSIKCSRRRWRHDIFSLCARAAGRRVRGWVWMTRQHPVPAARRFLGLVGRPFGFWDAVLPV